MAAFIQDDLAGRLQYARHIPIQKMEKAHLAGSKVRLSGDA